MLFMKSILTNLRLKLFWCTICDDFQQPKRDSLLSISERKLGSISNSENEKKKYVNTILPPEPEHCCMSGCANCVWVKYAEEIAKIMNDGGDTAKAKIFEQVKDPNLRAFLMIELDYLFKNKKS